MRPEGRRVRVPNVPQRHAVLVALAAAAISLAGAFQVWVRIRIAGFAPPGSAQTGWQGGDGRTIVAAAVAAVVAAAAVALGGREAWPKVLLLVAGAIALVIAVVNIVDAGSKANDIQVQFGIPAEDVEAQVGIGLYLVCAGGIGMVAAGVWVRSGPS